MLRVVQLRVVDPHEQFTVHDIDPSAGTVTIGQEDTDDILLHSPDSAFYHLEIEVRQPPYRLTIPAEARALTINGEFVPSGGTYEIVDRDVIRVAGYTITFRAYEEKPEIVAPPLPQPEPELPPPLQELPPKEPQEEIEPPEEELGPSIVSSLPDEAQAWILDVTQAAVLTLQVVNAGPLVAQFNVIVEGVPAEWVDVEPAEFHLNERAERTVMITVTPPRLPSSRAGTYPLTLIVSSPDHYPGERCETHAEVTVNPYYELAVGNASPRRVAIPSSQPSGQIEIPLTNKGNSDAFVGLSGEDDALASRFEFQVPAETEEPLHLTRQVNMNLPFAETRSIPVHVIPRNRPLIGEGGRLFDLRPRIHPYTITVTLPQGQQGPWTLVGEWENAPRFSRRVLSLLMFAALLLLLACTCVVFTPGIASPDQAQPAWIFAADDPPPDYARPASIRAGQVVELDWHAWPPFLVSFQLNGRPVKPPVYDRPDRTTTYELRAETWLSRLLPFWSDPAPDTVVVRPVEPDILLFEARPDRTLPGQTIILSWVVDDAARLILVDHGAGVQETLDRPYGSREARVGDDSTHYTLRAVGSDGDIIERVVSVEVGDPVIALFSVDPPVMTAPGVVTLTWEVLGTHDTQPITLRRTGLAGSGTPPAPTTTPLLGTRGTNAEQVDGTTLFSLEVGSGADQVVETLRVKLAKPAPAPAVALAPAVVQERDTEKRAGEHPDTIVVYTALSANEMSKFDLGAMPDRPLAAVPDSLSEAGLTLEELEEYDYIFTPPNGLEANILILRESTEDLISRLLDEKDDPRADVVWGVAATGLISLRAEGLLEPLAGIYAPQGLENIKDGWRDPTLPPEWLGLGAWITTFCIAEDGLVDAEGNRLPVPNSWDGLVDPRYEGLIAMPSPTSSGTGYMVVSGLVQMSPFGEPEGWAYMDRLHENISRYASSGSDPCDLVAPGQIAIGIGANICDSGDRSGGRLLIHLKQGAGWEIDGVALVRNDVIHPAAPHFVTWAISRPAMERYAEFRPVLSYDGFVPARACAPDVGEIEVDPTRFFWAAANRDRVTAQWQSRYGSEPH